MELLQTLWSTIKETIQKEYGLSLISYNTWIAPLELADVIDNTVYIKIPSDNQQALNYIQNKFKDFFQVTISEMMDEEYQIDFILNKEETPSEEPSFTPNIVNKVATFIYDTLKIVSALPGVKLLDKLAGMLFGIIEVTLVIWLIFIIMSLFDLYGLNTWLEQQVYDNIILTYLYNNNYLVEIIRLILTLKPL